jgi:sulfur carrier protein ThiS
MLRIRIKLYASLRRKLPGPEEHEMEVAEAATVAELLKELGIRPEEAAFVIINGKKAAPDSVLSDGDSIGVFPPLGGG